MHIDESYYKGTFIHITPQMFVAGKFKILTCIFFSIDKKMLKTLHKGEERTQNRAKTQNKETTKQKSIQLAHTPNFNPQTLNKNTQESSTPSSHHKQDSAKNQHNYNQMISTMKKRHRREESTTRPR